MFNQVVNGLPPATPDMVCLAEQLDPGPETHCATTDYKCYIPRCRNMRRSHLYLAGMATTHSVSCLRITSTLAMFHNLACRNADHLSKPKGITRGNDFEDILLRVPGDPEAILESHKDTCAQRVRDTKHRGSSRLVTEGHTGFNVQQQSQQVP